MLIRLLTFCCLILSARDALAGRVEIPLRVPLDALRLALSSQLAASSAAPNVIYQEGRCRYLSLQAPRLEAVDGRLRFVGPGSAALGLEVFGTCQNAAVWRGSLQFTLAPQADSMGRLRLRIVDSRLTDAADAPALGFIWELSKRHVHPRLQEFTYDLGALRAALLELVRSVAPPEHGAELERALNRLQVLEPRVEAAAIVVPIALEVPDAWLAAPPASAPAAPLSEAELEALDNALQPWDAFLLYSVRQVALDSQDSALRKRLFTLLLESRYQLTAILAGEAVAVGDPLRALFVDTWNELRTILVEAHREGLLGASWLSYAVFIDAGDALLALDSAAPGLGMRLSADGLRQLARSLRPADTADPLRYDWTVDPQLGRLFDVEGIPDVAPARVLPPPAPPPGRSWLELLIRSAHATSATATDPSAVRPLDRWVPRRDELDGYEARIGDLLAKTAEIELRRANLAAPYDRMFLDLVPATALIESCWRQYVVRGGKITYLRSSASSVGIMQINERVWRGFYDIQRLRWDTAYNTRAGAQILMRYVKDYAIPYAERSGRLDHVARAAYAVYNAGPRAVGRFAKAKRHPREARVDDRLLTLFQGIASGGRASLRTCGVTTAAASVE
jgi:hypothetical protein